MVFKKAICVCLLLFIIFIAGCKNNETNNNKIIQGKNEQSLVENLDISKIENVKELFSKITALEDDIFKDKAFSSRIIGKFNNIDVVEYVGKYNTFNSVEKELGKYFTGDMIELELRKRNLAIIDERIGCIQSSGEGSFEIEKNSQYKYILNELSKKVIEIQVFNDFNQEGKVQYTFCKMDDGIWRIIGEKGFYDNDRNPNITKYFIDWDNIQSSSRFEKFTPDLVLDGKFDTAWIEGVNGSGIGEWIEFRGANDKEVSGIEINNGYSRSKDTYYYNNRVKRIKIELSDGTVFKSVLNDNLIYDIQKVEFGKTIKTKFIKIAIEDVYKGSKYDDTCISEVRIY